MEPLLEYRDTAGSTNDIVASWIRAGCADGRGLWVGAQTGGRGRRGRTWAAPAGRNLTLSVAVVGARYQPVMLLVPLAAGVAAAEGLARVAGVDVGLKWPNDLVVGDRKLGGVLCEAVLDGARFVGAVVGVGLNVNSLPDEFPAMVRDRVVSVAELRGADTALGALAGAVRERIAATVTRLAGGDREGVLADWSARDATAGRRISHDGATGIALGIDADGGLRMRMDDGTERVARSGEVLFLGGGPVR